MLLRRCVEALVPSFADGCELDLRGDGQLVRIVAGIDREAAERRERSAVPSDTHDHPIVAVLQGGPARLLDLDNPADEPLFGPADDAASARSLGMTTAILTPVVIGGRVLGSLAFGRGPSGRRFGPDDVGSAVDHSRRIGLAWHNAVLLAERASILASLNDGLVVSDAHGVVLEVNERWSEITGFPREVCVGATMPYPWWPDADSDAAAHHVIGVVAQEALGGRRLEERLIFRRADGTLFPALVSVAPMLDEASGEPRALVASIKDLTLREAARADLAALQRVTSRLAAAGNIAEIVAGVLDELAAARTGAEAVYVTQLDSSGQNLEVAGWRGPLGELVHRRGGFSVQRGVPSNAAVRDGETVVVCSASDLVRSFPDIRPEVEELGLSSVVATPVRRRGEAIGAISLWSRRRDAFGTADVEFLEAVAIQLGQALQRAEGYESEHRVSQALQGRLLSDVPVLHERATIVTRYQPASSEVAVGGDWYDVVPLGQDTLAVVVGDVVGSGVEAAAVMGQLRSALKGIAFVNPEPIAVLTALDRLAAATAGAPAATVCYALVDLAAGTVRYSRAGHPPPLLVSGAPGGDARFLAGHADLPLGLREGERRESSATLASGDVLLLYTDGLIERRDAGLDVRLEVLRASAASARRDTVDGLVDDVLAACIGDTRLRDDLAVLALRDEPGGPGRLRIVVGASPRQLRPVRHALRDWLRHQGLDDQHVAEIVLATSEAATNAVEHAYRDVAGGAELIGVTATIEGDEVVVGVRDTGRWKARPSDTTRGRGLAIARSLGEVEIRSGASGTTVTFRWSVSGARTRAR